MSPGRHTDWLFGLEKLGMKLGLESSRTLCRLLGHPERSFAPVLVAGTNGKGSVAAMLDAILTRAGVRTGLFTSPHLVRVEERIRIGGREIDSDRLEASLGRIRDLGPEGGGRSGRGPTFFEALTAAAFDSFARAGIDTAILEVGMGGRFDATNVTEPALSIVCSVDRDHEKHLGSDLASIAAEKAGVFRPGRPALIGAVAPEPRATLERIARERDSLLIDVPAEVRTTLLEDGLGAPGGTGLLRAHIRTPHGSYEDLRIPLPGRHQLANAALAVRAAEVLLCPGDSPAGGPLEPETVREGLATTRWPGRLEWVDGKPPLLLDCAHNPAGARTLAGALRRIGPHRCVLLFGAMRDKDFRSIASELAGAVRSVVCASPRIERAAPSGDLAAAMRAAAPELQVLEASSVAGAIELARSLAGPSGVVCVAGSIFLVGEVKATVAAAAGP